ncbi:unnamed protein product, partial [Didymodactylos carnosus]
NLSNNTMNLEFTVTETITRHNGIINEIYFEFEEFIVGNTSVGITNKKERRSRISEAGITRNEYNKLAKNPLSFDNFILVIRPFIMGYYENDELKQTFQILDNNKSGSIDINELANF